MLFLETALPGAYLIEPEKRGDERGFFARVFCTREFGDRGLETRFLQGNDSLSVTCGTLRGMHFQFPPHAETKLVRCIQGRLYDVIVDLRSDSPAFGKWTGIELSAANRRMLYVPRGFAHGFVTLAPDTEVLYLVSNAYAPHAEGGLRWDDPALGIAWPVTPLAVSEKDRRHPDFDPAAFRLLDGAAWRA